MTDCAFLQVDRRKPTPGFVPVAAMKQSSMPSCCDTNRHDVSKWSPLTMIAWFFTHGTQNSLGQVLHDGAFVIKEGTKQEGGIETASLRGLTIASAAVSAPLHLVEFVAITNIMDII